MAVSKNKRKNADKRKRSGTNKRSTAHRTSGEFTLATGLKGFAGVLSNIRSVSNLYVKVTRGIPNYQELNADLLPGLQKAIPILKELTLERTAIESDFIELRKSGYRVDDFAYGDLMQRFERMSYRLGTEFMDAFLPIFDTLESLAAKYSDVDQELIAATRTTVDAYCPKFTTELGEMVKPVVNHTNQPITLNN